MNEIVDRKIIARALKEAARRSVSWQHWKRENRAGKLAAASLATNYEVTRFSFSIDRLLALPEEHQELFLVATKVANDMVILHRQLQIHFQGMAQARDSGDRDETHVQNMLSFSALTQLLAKSFEGYDKLRDMQKMWNAAGGIAMMQEGREEWAKLNALFGDNRLAIIRHKLGHHYDSEFLQRNLRSFVSPGDESQYEMVLSSDYTNTFFLQTELLALQSLLEVVSPGAPLKLATEQVFNLASDVGGRLISFSTYAALAVLDGIGPIERGDDVPMSRRPCLDNLVQPFFVAPSSEPVAE